MVIDSVIWAILIVIACGLITRASQTLWLKPARVRSALRRQGISGPPPTFFVGNSIEANRMIQSKLNLTTTNPPPPCEFDRPHLSDDWLDSIYPHLQHWARIYGKVYMFSTGTKQHLYIADPQLLKEINLHKSFDLGRPSSLSQITKPLLGEGILKSNGPSWAFQRKLIAPHFFAHEIKGMAAQMEETVRVLISQWESKIQDSRSSSVEVVVDEDLLTVSADIISKCCFGSSYLQGKQIFAKLAALQSTLSRPNYIFESLPILRYFPTAKSKEASKLQKEVDGLIVEVVNKRIEDGKASGEQENDLLQSILVASGADKGSRVRLTSFIVDNCKTIYFAGSKTTALTASWCLLHLALYPEWQERVRAEIDLVLSENDQLITMEAMQKLKVLTMVIHETLRLYGPSVIATREAFGDVKLGGILVPKETCLWTLLPVLHRDPDYWGSDANEFNPERFVNGHSEASKHPFAYLPFGSGPRVCLGMNFAMLELKIVLSLLILNFHFSASPEYKHSPICRMVLVPGNGIRLIARSV
ncbi:unnamed protein product [Rhodiola kirilowii]